MAAPGAHALGALPSPFDLSYMKGQHPAKQARPSGLPALVGYSPTYDLRGLGKLTAVRDQGSCGGCWTFATMAALESRLLPDETRDFSENNLDDTAGYDLLPCAGGNYLMSAAYLSRWSGPWNETDDPYTVTGNKQAPTYPSANAQKHMQEVLYLPDRGSSTDNDNIKWAVSTYGAVYTTYYDEAQYHNSTYDSYYYSGAAVVNHGVAIVGWDDNFAAGKFNTAPPGNGAFIIRNSWGASWGENGYFYVSYYDANIKTNTVFVSTDSNVNYRRVYQYDPLGQTSAIGYAATTAWFSNVFTAQDANSQVSAVSFYTLALDSTYDIYVYTEMPTPGDPRSGTLASSQSGSSAYAGYHTIPLTTKVPLSNGQVFTIVVRITTPGYNWPIPMETPVASFNTASTAGNGQSYISAAGTVWEDLNVGFPNTNANLKAFTSYTADGTAPSAPGAVNDGTGRTSPIRRSPRSWRPTGPRPPTRRAASPNTGTPSAPPRGGPTWRTGRTTAMPSRRPGPA